jgi:hypothetical protein
MILSEDTFTLAADSEEEFTVTFSGPTKLSADTSYSFTLIAQVDSIGQVPYDWANANASYNGDFTVSTYGMVELEMSDKSTRNFGTTKNIECNSEGQGCNERRLSR